MKMIKALALSLFFTCAYCLSANPPAGKAILADIPAKTIIIKNSAAQNPDQFFANSTSISFEVYKIGSDLQNTVDKIRKNKEVQSVDAGKATGDYQAMTITLKTTKDKAFWGSLFKSAGLNNIKINNNEITGVDKM